MLDMSSRPRLNPVGRFFLLVVLWLPFCLFIWYFMAPTVTWPLGLLADWVMTTLFPDRIEAVEQIGDKLDIVTLMPLPKELLAQLPPGSTGDLVFTLNPLIYSYGLALFSALIIAVPGEEATKWRHWLLSLPILLLAQVWGVCFDILRTLLFTMGPETAEQMAFSAAQREMVALGYQLGYLILPPVLPVVIWVILSREYLAALVWGSDEAVKKG